MEDEKTYKIVRFYRDDRPREIIDTGLSLEEAQAHCSDPHTKGEDWFDGYQEEWRPLLGSSKMSPPGGSSIRRGPLRKR